MKCKILAALAAAFLAVGSAPAGTVPLGSLVLPAGDVIIAEEDFGIAEIGDILVDLDDIEFGGVPAGTGGSVLAAGSVLDLTGVGTVELDAQDLTGFTDVDFFFNWATTGNFTDGSSFEIIATAEGADFSLFLVDSTAVLSGATGAPFFEFFASPPAGATDGGLDALLSSGLDLSSVVFSVVSTLGDGSDGTIFLDSLLVTGTPVPEPTAIALLTACGVLVPRRRRR